jgi:hypothetical protein
MHEGGYYINGHYVPTMPEMIDYAKDKEPYASSVRYGYYTIYLCGVSLGIFFLFHGFKVASFWYRYVLSLVLLLNVSS